MTDIPQVATTPTVTVDLPPTFYDDHVSRELPAGTVLHRTKSYVRVELTREEYDEVLSDAQHYADPDPSWTIKHDAYLLGISRSAQAAVKRLQAVTPPDEAPAKLPTLRERLTSRTGTLSPFGQKTVIGERLKARKTESSDTGSQEG